MNGNRRAHVKRILQAIENGTLPPTETERRLRALIEEEVTQTDSLPDEEFVFTCIALWDELHDNTDAEYEMRAVRLRLKLDKVLHKRKKQRGAMVKVIAAVAAVIMLVAGISIPLRTVWFESHSTPDEQQHVMMGHELTVDMVESAIADSYSVDTGTVKISDFSQVDDVIGLPIHIPESLGEEWVGDRGYVNFSPGYIKVTLVYVNDKQPDKRMTCLINIYTDVDMAYFSFEQTREGELVCADGLEFYVSDNMGRTSACWYNNVMYICVAGELECREITEIMLLIIGEEQ